MDNKLRVNMMKCLNKEIDKDDMNLICSILRGKGYGRNELQGIGNNPLKLYDTMSKRGDVSADNHSFLINILVEAEQNEAAKQIRDLINTYGPPADNARPQNLSMKNGAKRPLPGEQVGVEIKRRNYSSSRSQSSLVSPDGIETSSLPLRRHYLSQENCCYSMEKERHSLVAIINNFTEKNSPMYRKGTIEDEERIQKFFKSEDFKGSYKVMKPLRDLNKEGFQYTLNHWADRLNDEEDSINSFILFIMSHGDKEGVKTYYTNNTKSEDNVISVETIVNTFKSCLKGCPKMIVIQACMGESDNGAESVQPDAIRPTIQQPDELGDDPNIEEVEGDSPIQITVPDAADMLTAMATVRGYRSYRGKGCDGSWFIRDFIKQLEESHKPEYYSTHMVDVLTEVQRQVAERRGKTTFADSDGENKKVYVKQMPCYQSTLRKKFYLLPPRLPYTLGSRSAMDFS